MLWECFNTIVKWNETKRVKFWISSDCLLQKNKQMRHKIAWVEGAIENNGLAGDFHSFSSSCCRLKVFVSCIISKMEKKFFIYIYIFRYNISLKLWSWNSRILYYPRCSVEFRPVLLQSEREQDCSPARLRNMCQVKC